MDRGPVRPYPQVRLAQMQDFQGDGSVTLDMLDMFIYLFGFFSKYSVLVCMLNSVLGDTSGFYAIQNKLLLLLCSATK